MSIPFRHLIILAALAAVFTGCKSRAVRPESPAERIEREIRIGSELSQRLDARLKFKHDTEVQVYLRQLAKTLIGGEAAGVLIVDDSAESLQDFSLPGNRIYLSDRLLKKLEFENEVAAALALEVGHLMKGHVVAKLKKKSSGTDAAEPAEPAPLEGLLPAQPGQLPPAVEFFGPGGIFAFDDREQTEAIAFAVQLLYARGFDPRGLVTIWSLLGTKGQDTSRQLEETRKEISNFPPLRNPVVKSKAFAEIRKRILAL